MAIRHSADAEYLLYSAAGPTVPCTTMAWVTNISDLNDFQSYFRHAGGSDGWYASTSSTGNNYQCQDDTTPGTTGSAVAYDGSWVHLTLVLRTGTGSTNVEQYLNGVSDSTRTDSGGVGPLTDIRIGGNTTGRDGRVCAVKCWSGVELTNAEILAEMRSIRPVRLANLWGFWPCFDIGDLRDLSGNGRTLVMTGTHDTQDGPPVSWGAQPLGVFIRAIQSPATFAVWSPGVSFTHGYGFPITASAFDVTPTAATFKRTYVHTVAAATFSVTPTAATFKRTYVHTITAAAFDVTPTAAAFRRTYVHTVAASTFDVTPTAATFKRAYVHTVAAATFDVTPTAVGLLKKYVFTDDETSTFGLSPTVVGFLRKYVFTDDETSAFNVSPTAAKLLHGGLLAADLSTFEVSPQTVGLTYTPSGATYTLSVSPSTFNLIPATAGLIYTTAQAPQQVIVRAAGRKRPGHRWYAPDGYCAAQTSAWASYHKDRAIIIKPIPPRPPQPRQYPLRPPRPQESFLLRQAYALSYVGMTEAQASVRAKVVYYSVPLLDKRYRSKALAFSSVRSSHLFAPSWPSKAILRMRQRMEDEALLLT